MRLHAELPRTALATDLEIGASQNQSSVVRFFQASQTVGTAPTCPPPPDWCTDPNAPENNSWSGFWGNEEAAAGGNTGCAIGGGVGSSAILGGLALSLGLALARRRRRASIARY
jgi:hypothetical protein